MGSIGRVRTNARQQACAVGLALSCLGLADEFLENAGGRMRDGLGRRRAVGMIDIAPKE
jgi:hypothetical protein